MHSRCWAVSGPGRDTDFRFGVSRRGAQGMVGRTYEGSRPSQRWSQRTRRLDLFLRRGFQGRPLHVYGGNGMVSRFFEGINLATILWSMSYGSDNSDSLGGEGLLGLRWVGSWKDGSCRTSRWNE